MHHLGDGMTFPPMLWRKQHSAGISYTGALCEGAAREAESIGNTKGSLGELERVGGREGDEAHRERMGAQRRGVGVHAVSGIALATSLPGGSGGEGARTVRLGSAI
jgi:hypothetical protein